MMLGSTGSMQVSLKKSYTTGSISTQAMVMQTSKGRLSHWMMAGTTKTEYKITKITIANTQKICQHSNCLLHPFTVLQFSLTLKDAIPNYYFQIQVQPTNKSQHPHHFILYERQGELLIIYCVSWVRIRNQIKIQMIGPQYEKLAQIQQRMTAKQMLQKIKNRPDNPLARVIDKLKKQFTEYETAYTDPIMDYQISSLDRILSFDSKLGPILDTLEKQNLLLRKELGVLEGQLSNTVGICEQILAENNELKIIVKRKNEDISKIIETIANNQAQESSQIEQKNGLLIRQNSILMTHLEEIKKQHQKYASSFRENEDERNQMNRKVVEMKKQLNQSLSRERELSRKVSLLEESVFSNRDELYQLRQTNENLTVQNNQLKNEVLILKGKGEGTNYQTIKRDTQAQYEPIIREYKQLKSDRVNILREVQKLKLQRESWESNQSGLDRQVNKISEDLRLTTSLLREQKELNSRQAKIVSNLESRVNQLMDEVNKLKAEKQVSGSVSINREKQLLQEIDGLAKKCQLLRREDEKRVQDINRSMNNLVSMKQRENQQLKEEITRLERRLEHR